SVWRHLSNARHIGDVKIAAGVRGKPCRTAKLGARCGTAISNRSRSTVTGDGGNHTVRRDLANAVMAHVGDEEIAGPIDDYIGCPGEFRGERRTAIARCTRRSNAGNGVNYAVEADSAYAIIERIAKEDITAGIEGNACNTIQQSLLGQCPVRRVALACSA